MAARGTSFFRGLCFCALSLALAGGTLFAADYTVGRIRLTLHERTGRFSLFYRTDLNRNLYEPFFLNADPRTSFLAVQVNDRSYRLGDDPAFRVRLGGGGENPALIFESPFLVVTQEFSFFQLSGSREANGVRMTIRVENRADPAAVGIRLLLDTSLGEGNRLSEHFFTDLQTISAETALDRSRQDQWWITRNNRYGLMGSISFRESTPPDLIHFSTWKRLHDAPWKLDYAPGRSFAPSLSSSPSSEGDSALCYYYEAAPLGRYASRSVSVLLAAADPRGFDSMVAAADESLVRLLEESGLPLSPTDESRRADLETLNELLRRMDQAVAGERFLSDEDLKTLELVIARLRARYGLP